MVIVQNAHSRSAEFDGLVATVTAAIETGDLVLAESGIEKLSKLAPEEVTILYSLVDFRMAIGNYASAIKALEEVPSALKENKAFQIKAGSYRRQIEKKLIDQNLELPSVDSRSFLPFDGVMKIYPGLKVVMLDSISDVRSYFSLQRSGQILEQDIDRVEHEEDKFERARRDAEVLTTLASNCSGSVLELGTSYGQGTYKLATNLPAPSIVYTVNILPEQFIEDCSLVTHLISKEEIGKYYRAHGIKNVEQYYENTLHWRVPQQIANLSMVFIDAAHDAEAVYKDSLLTWCRLAPGGFMVWHDFTPIFRDKYGWIDSSMNGVAKFLATQGIDVEVVNLKYSWMGILRKPHSSRALT